MQLLMVLLIKLIVGLDSLNITDPETSALALVNADITIHRSNSDFDSLAHDYYRRALINQSLPLKSKEIVEDLTESAKYFKLVKNTIGYHRARLALAKFYTREDLFLTDARNLAEEALEFFKSEGMDRLEIEAASGLGEVLLAQYDFDQGIDVVSSALDKSLVTKNKSLEIQNRLLLSQLLGSMGKVEEAVEMARSVVNIENKLEQVKYSPIALRDMGYYYYKDKNFELAISRLREAQLIADLSYDLEVSIYETLSKCHEEMQDVDEALFYLKKADALKDAQRDSEKYTISNQIALEYQTKEKEKEIENLLFENESRGLKLKQSNRLNAALAALMAALILAGYYIQRFYSQRIKTRHLINEQREELDSQRIYKLENDLKIKSLESMVNGQEIERTRIANDLHDSLGGLLSTLKLQYDALQMDHIELSEDRSYQKIYHLIDHACGEVRDIARNLKPASLEKIGLTAAINDLINRYSANGNPEIFLHSNKIDDILTNDKKLHVYRIVQELLNNALKHAEATELDVQLTRREKELFLKVEDNGKGFEENSVKKGLGLENIRSRLNMLNGELEFDSSPNHGTSVMINIPLDK